MWLRIVRLLRWRASERDIDEELRFHVDMEAEAHMRRGVDRAEARRRALSSFGGEDRWREETRAARRTAWVEDLARDARYGFRAMWHAPAFSSAALATITLGVGATTAIFSVVQAVLLAPLPYPEPGELVTVWMRNPAQNIEEDVTSWPNFVDWREQSTSLERLATVRGAVWALTGDGDPEEVRGAFVSRGFFELIGAPMALGRGFRDEEVEGEAAAAVVVLSHELFSRRFGADPTLVGRTILLDDVPHEVVGVTAAGLAYPRDAQLWAPQHFSGGLAGFREARGALWLPVVGRLADGVDLAAAQAEMDGVARRLEEAYPVANEGVGITLEPFQETLVGDVRTPLLVLFGAVALVLLIAVVNVANLLLARGASRARELAVRLTLGAGKGRVVRQMLAESLVLGLGGALAGTAAAIVGVRLLLSVAPSDLPRVEDVGIDGRALAFALLVALGASLVFGLVPALQARRVDPGSGLREGARGSSSAGLARLRGAFVTGQFGLALVLLVGAGLLGRSFLKLRAVDPGFEPSGVLSTTLSLPASRYPSEESVLGFYDAVHASVGAVPGATGAGTINSLFLPALPNMGRIAVEGRPQVFESSQQAPVVQAMASPGFFEASGMRLLAGRLPNAGDGPESPPVAVVNESFVRLFLDGADPLQARFVWGSDADGDGGGWISVIGVVADTRRSGLDRPVRPEALLPVAQAAPRRMDLLVRTTGDPLSLAQPIREAIHRIDPRLPLTRVRTLEQAMSEGLAPRRFVTWLLGVFAVTALGLAAVGVFGTMAYVVGQRSREIGIRVALGAERSTVLGQVLGEGLRYAGLGLLVGGVLAVGLTRYLRAQLFGLEPTDPVTFALAAAVLVAVACLACTVPARRAAAVDPVVALRQE